MTGISDDAKDIVALYEYDAFGNIITKCGSLANDFLFSTQLSNSNAGWHMYMFRNYDPQLGRWTQRDPIGGLNQYSYVYNSPICFVDILGLWPSWSDIGNSLNNAVNSAVIGVGNAVESVTDAAEQAWDWTKGMANKLVCEVKRGMRSIAERIDNEELLGVIIATAALGVSIAALAFATTTGGLAIAVIGYKISQAGFIYSVVTTLKD